MVDRASDWAAEQGGTSALLPERTVDMLALFYGPGSALLFFAALLTNLFYRLDSKAHAVIMLDLKERRRAAANAVSLVA